MEKQNTLIDLLKTFLKDYERIDKIDETLPSIYSYISDKIHFNNNGTFPSSIPSGLTDSIEGDANQIFWVQRIANLLKIFNDNFKILETNEDETRKEEYLSYAENMKIIKNRQRINVEDLNDNFKLISTGFKLITDELFGTAIAENNKYLVMFNGIAKELIPLWENVLYLWLSFLLKEREKIEKPIVIFAYLNESQLINHQKFDGKKINLNVQDGIDINYILDRIECYIDEFPNSHLCVIPIIRQLTDQKYYGEECYPGIFYHAPNFNSQLLKCDRKFMYYPFRDMGTKGHDKYEPFNPFQPSIIFHFERRFLRAGFLNTISDDSDSYLQLGDVSYGYRIYGDHLYYAAPYNNIPNIKEIIPKKYYSAVKSFVSGSFFIDNGVLMISGFAINYQDMVGYNVDRTANNNIVAQYKPDIDNANYLCLSLDDALANTDKRYVLKEAIFMKSEKTEVNSHTLTKVRNFRDRIAKDSSFKFQYFDSSCISGQTQSIEEDYSYLIEYIPLKYEQPNSGENNWIRESNMSTLKTYVDSNLKTKDNDLLEKHVAWDNERNNILEDKFVLRIGQHIEADAVPAHSDLIPDDFKFEDNIKYFDYKSTLNHDIEEKTSGTVKYYNNGTTEVGAYLNIPFIKQANKRLQFYPDFISHNFGSDNLIPLTSIEYRNDSDKSEYFSYDKIFRDYPVEKDVYFQIYTQDGKEHFNNDNWCVKMIEVISQDTPIKESFFEEADLPPYTVSSMEELYNYYQNNKNKIIDKKVLPYFSQLNPYSGTSTGEGEYLKRELKKSIKGSYSSFFPQLFGDKTEQMYDAIAEALIKNIDNKKQSTYFKNIANIRIQGEDPVEGTSYDYFEPVNIQLEIFGNNNTLAGLKDIDSNWSSISSSNTNFNYFYKNYTQYDKNGQAVKTYSFPKSQLDIASGSLKLYDETYYDYISNNGIEKVRFLYNNFACTHRVFPRNSEATFKYLIFGANIPLRTFLGDLPQVIPLEPPSNVTGVPNTSGTSSSSPLQEYNYWNFVGYDPNTSFWSGLQRFKYYSCLNPGNTLVYAKGDGPIANVIINNNSPLVPTTPNIGLINVKGEYASTSLTITMPPSLSPFLNILGYSSWSLNSETLTVSKNRQYPHIYLSSQKTLIINKRYRRKEKISFIKHFCYKENNSIKKLLSYYNKLPTLQIDTLSKIPYPFPSNKIKKQLSSYPEETIIDLGKQELMNQVNFAYPNVSPLTNNENSGDPYIYGLAANAPSWAAIIAQNNVNKYKGLISGSYPDAITPTSESFHYSTTQNQAIGDYREYSLIIFDEIFRTETEYGLKGLIPVTAYKDKYGIPFWGGAYYDKTIQVHGEWIGSNVSNDLYTYLGNDELNPSIELNYEKNSNIISTNLQIIIHYFGPNGTYARKVMTRQLTDTVVNPNDHFEWDGTSDSLTYKEWTNNWKIEYLNQALYNEFKTSLNSKKIFKQSPQVKTEEGIILDFESYPNTGLSSEDTHQES